MEEKIKIQSQSISKQFFNQENLSQIQLYQKGKIQLEQQKIQNGLRLLNMSLEKTRQKYGQQSQRQIIILKSIVSALYKKLDYSLARQNQQKIFYILTKKQDKQSRKYNQCIYQLGQLFMFQKNYKKAIQYISIYSKFIEITQAQEYKLYNLYKLYKRLGHCFFKLKKYHQALKCYKFVLYLKKKFSPFVNIIDAMIVKDIGFMNSFIGQSEKAIELFKKSISICQQINGYNQETLIRSLSCLGYQFQKSGQYQQAQKNFLRVLQILEKQQNSKLKTNQIHFCLNKLAEVYAYQRKNQKALIFAQKSLQFLSKYKQENKISRQFFNIYRVFALIYRQLKQYPKSIQYYQKCFDIISNPLYEYQEDIPFCNVQLGYILFLQNKYQQASQYYQKARNVYQKDESIVDNFHFGVLLLRISKIKITQGKIGEAKTLLQEAKKQMEKRLGKRSKNLDYLELLKQIQDFKSKY